MRLLGVRRLRLLLAQRLSIRLATPLTLYASYRVLLAAPGATHKATTATGVGRPTVRGRFYDDLPSRVRSELILTSLATHRQHEEQYEEPDQRDKVEQQPQGALTGVMKASHDEGDGGHKGSEHERCAEVSEPFRGKG